MDISMPVMDGIEATRVIRSMEKHSNTPIIALTAHTSTQTEKLCREAGMVDYLTKPSSAEKIWESINKLGI